MFQDSRFLRSISSKGFSHSKQGIIEYIARRFYGNAKYRDFVFDIIYNFWRLNSKQSVMESKLFPYILMCVKKGLIKREEVQRLAPYLDTLLRKIPRLTPQAILKLRHLKELKNHDRRIAYQIEKIYPDKAERWLTQKIRDHEEDVTISPPIDYPQYIYAMSERKYRKIGYYPQMILTKSLLEMAG